MPESDLESGAHEQRGVIIDPGHGGKDGGAVSVTGTAEKELNLFRFPKHLKRL